MNVVTFVQNSSSKGFSLLLKKTVRRPSTRLESARYTTFRKRVVERGVIVKEHTRVRALVQQRRKTSNPEYAEIVTRKARERHQDRLRAREGTAKSLPEKKWALISRETTKAI